jgi:CRISPR system Cascade subunit CasA
MGDLSESSNKVRLFQGRSGLSKKALTYPEAARWLLYLNAFDDTSSKPTRGTKEKLPSPGAGWLGKLGIIYAVGKNLFETLLLNLVLHDENGIKWDEGCTIWELKEPRAAERTEIPLPRSQAALLTLQSRRVLLERTNDVVTGYRLLGGDFFQKENAFSEQMTMWRRDKNREDVYTPKRHDTSKQLWRDFTALLAKNEKTRLPGIVSWLMELEDAGLIATQQVQLCASSVQYGDKDFFVTNVWDDSISINAGLLSEIGDNWIARILGELVITEKVVNSLGYLASDIAKASGDKNEGAGRRNAAKEEAYFRLDEHFRTWLSAINPQTDNMEETCGRWRKTVDSVVKSIGKELVAEAGGRAFVGRMVKERGNEYLITAPGAHIKFMNQVSKVLTEG